MRSLDWILFPSKAPFFGLPSLLTHKTRLEICSILLQLHKPLSKLITLLHYHCGVVFKVPEHRPLPLWRSFQNTRALPITTVTLFSTYPSIAHHHCGVAGRVMCLAIVQRAPNPLPAAPWALRCWQSTFAGGQHDSAFQLLARHLNAIQRLVSAERQTARILPPALHLQRRKLL